MSFIAPPAPPTDNLYKFLAISGVLLLLAAPVYWSAFEIKLEERYTQAWVALYRQLETPGEYFVPPRFENTPEGAKAREKWEALKAKIEAEDVEHFRARRQLRELEQFERLVSVVSASAAVLGFVLACLGFRLWYVRVQLPLDRLLGKQLSEADTQAQARARADAPAVGSVAAVALDVTPEGAQAPLLPGSGSGKP